MLDDAASTKRFVMNRNIKSLFFPFALTALIASCNNGNRVNSATNFLAEDSDSIVTYSDPTLNEPLVLQSEETEVEQEEPKKSNGFEGKYYCSRSKDTYYFDEDNTGGLIPNGAVTATNFKWQRTGSKIVITFTGDDAYLGKTTLKYDKKKGTITEKSEIFGLLVFDKE